MPPATSGGCSSKDNSGRIKRRRVPWLVAAVDRRRDPDSPEAPMNREETAALFDRQAAGYDSQWARMAPVRDGLYFLVEAVFATLPADAHVLGVGVGTGAELAFLAKRFPGWRFTAVEP